MAYKYYKSVPATGALRGVHDPGRFTKYSTCQSASGVVTYVENWNDYDWDVYIDLDSGSQNLVTADDIKNLQKWSEAQQTKRHPAAEMLWEVVGYDQGSQCGSGSQSSGGLSKPSQGDHVQVTGAYVRDNNHDYKEIHRLYQIGTCTAALKDPV